MSSQQNSRYPIDAKEAAGQMADAANRIDRVRGIPIYWRESSVETAADGYLAGYRAGLADARAIVADLATTKAGACPLVCGTCRDREGVVCDLCGNGLPPGRYPLRDTTPAMTGNLASPGQEHPPVSCEVCGGTGHVLINDGPASTYCPGCRDMAGRPLGQKNELGGSCDVA